MVSLRHRSISAHSLKEFRNSIRYALQFSATGKRGAPMKRSPSFKAGEQAVAEFAKEPATAKTSARLGVCIFRPEQSPLTGVVEHYYIVHAVDFGNERRAIELAKTA